jgi:transcriptional regulator with XRE-family HTH domain
MGKREFGEYIERVRVSQGILPLELAKRLGRKSKDVVYSLEGGTQDATIEDINILARELHVSVESLLLAHGARINPPEAALLPYDLVKLLLQLHPGPELRAVEATALGQLALRHQLSVEQLLERQTREPSS